MLPEALALLVRQLAREEPLPDGTTVLALDAADEARLASRAGLSLLGAQVAAVGAGVMPRRYLRNLRGCAMQTQLRLLRSRVALVGLGGLGGHLLEGLARMGVGHIRAADGDVFEEHNLNRQLLATMETLRGSKARAARERVADVNPAVELDVREEFLDAAGLPEFLAGAAVAVDALGGLAGRLELQRAAARAGIPLVTGAVAGQSGYVAVVLPGAAGPAEYLGEKVAAEASLGTPPASVAVVAGLMLQEVLRLLAGGASPLAGGMLLLDLQAQRFETVRLRG